MPSWINGLIALVGAGALAACSGGPAIGADADAGDGGDGPGDVPGFEVALPAPPVLTPCPEGWEEVPGEEPGGVTTCEPWPDGDPVTPPQMTPCPDGWREVTDPETGTVTCDPWPETGYEECTAVDEAHFPGEPGCTRIGTACPPDDDWATDLPTDQPILYVLAGAPEGGDGSRASPFGRVADAMAAAADGTVIALSKGAFDEVVDLHGGVTLWGACVRETVLASAPSEATATVTVSGSAAVLRNLRISGERLGVIAGGRGRSLEVRDVAVTGAVKAGVSVGDRAQLVAAGLIVRDTRSAPSDHSSGRGVEVGGGASVDVTRAVVERNREVAVLAAGAATSLALSDVAIVDTQVQEAAGIGGWGLQASEGAVATVTRVVFEGNRDVAIAALYAGTALTVVDTVVRDTEWGGTDRTSGGKGLQVQEGATASVTGAVFDRNRDVAVIAGGPGTSVSLSDLVVRDTGSRDRDRTRGYGLEAASGATIVLTRAIFERNRELAIVAHDAGTEVTLDNLVVRDTQGRESDLARGRGLQASGGARAQMSRAVFERNREIAIVAATTGTSVVLADVVVRDTRGRDNDHALGEGLHAQDGAQVQAARALFEGNRYLAIAAGNEGTSVTLSDLVVRDTRSQESDRTGGSGLWVSGGAAVEAGRAAFLRNCRVAVVAYGSGASLALSDVVVADTMEEECGSDGCPGEAAGHGIGSYCGGYVEASRFLVVRSALAGIQLAHGTGCAAGGTADLHDGEVAFNEVCGANVQTEGFDLARLLDRVLFHDNNGQNLCTSALPVPGAAAPIGE